MAETRRQLKERLKRAGLWQPFVTQRERLKKAGVPPRAARIQALIDVELGARQAKVAAALAASAKKPQRRPTNDFDYRPEAYGPSELQATGVKLNR